MEPLNPELFGHLNPPQSESGFDYIPETNVSTEPPDMSGPITPLKGEIVEYLSPQILVTNEKEPYWVQIELPTPVGLDQTEFIQINLAWVERLQAIFKNNKLVQVNARYKDEQLNIGAANDGSQSGAESFLQKWEEYRPTLKATDPRREPGLIQSNNNTASKIIH